MRPEHEREYVEYVAGRLPRLHRLAYLLCSDAHQADDIVQAQSAADTRYFVEICGRPMTAAEVETVKATVLSAYRWQYIVSGVQIPRFADLLKGMITPAQGERIGNALAPIMA